MLVTGSNGIGFYPAHDITNPLPQIIFGPEKLAVKQVVCKESYVVGKEEFATVHDECMLTLIALSDDDEIYVVTGKRDLENQSLPSFEYSAVPLRSDVSHISCQYNRCIDAIEVLYQTAAENQVFLLTRDNFSSMWTSTPLQIKVPQAKQKRSVFLTTIVISNGLGLPIPDGYPVHLTADPTFVLVNEQSCRLNRKRPLLVHTTGGIGQIQIKTFAPQDLGVPPVFLSLFKFINSGQEQPKLSINIAQRVTDRLGAIKSQADLDSLRSVEGAPLFANYRADDRSAASTLLTNFGALYNGIDHPDSGGAPGLTDTAFFACETGVEALKSVTANELAPDWLSYVPDVVIGFLGDAIECLRLAVKSVTKFVFKIIGSQLSFLIKVGAKVLKFVITNTVALVKSIVGFLKDRYDFDTLAFFGFKFDFRKISETQTVCEESKIST